MATLPVNCFESKVRGLGVRAGPTRRSLSDTGARAHTPKAKAKAILCVMLLLSAVHCKITSLELNGVGLFVSRISFPTKSKGDCCVVKESTAFVFSFSVLWVTVLLQTKQAKGSALLFVANQTLLLSMNWWEGVEEPRVLIAPDPGTSGDGMGRMILLRHPKSGNATQYLFVNGMLQELQWFKNLYGSWFLGDYISEDGRLYLSTPVDPVFIMLPIFADARMKKGDDPGKFRQLDEILFIDGYPGYQQLLSSVENCMQVVCDVKEVGSLKFFRLDDSKVLRWLCYKVNQLKQTLPKLDKNYAVQEEKDTLADAVSILGEYLKDEPWLQLLCNHLKLNILEVTGKAQATQASAEGSNSGFCDELKEKSDDKKAAIAKKGRQAKKVKLETESHNIREMFSRASRKKS